MLEGMQSDCNIMMFGGKDLIDCYLGLVYNAIRNITTCSPKYRRVLFMFSSACGRIDVSILKLSQEFEYESLTKKRVAVFS